MILPNATITAYYERTAFRGGSPAKPVLQTLALAAPVPVESGRPRYTHTQTAQAAGVRVDRVIEIEPEALAARAITPKVGDRLTVQPTRRLPAGGAAPDAEHFAVTVVERFDDPDLAGALEAVQLMLQRMNTINGDGAEVLP